MWVLTYVIGILPDWCSSIQRSLVSTIANRIGVATNGLILVAVGAYHCFFTISLMKHVGNIQIVLGLVWCATYLTTIVCFLIFCTQHAKLKAFFGQFDTMEEKLLTRDNLPLNTRTTRCFVTISLVRCVITAVCASIVAVFFGDSSSLSNSKVLRNVSPLAFLQSLEIVSLFYVFIINAASEIVPSLVFFQAALVVQTIETKAIEKITAVAQSRRSDSQLEKEEFFLEEYFVKLWEQFDDIRRLVDQANQTFGFLMAFNHGLIFLVVCCATYVSLNILRSADASRSIPYLIGLFLLIAFSIVLTSFMTGQMERASHSFASSLSSFSSHNWCRLTKPEQKIVLIITKKFRSFSMRARPLDLYSVNRAFILTQLSFIVTYTVILFQSN